MISIIVPCYNVQEYLDACILSIINQTISDWELILVDDGSPDNSGKICDEYAARDKRIKVIHKENGGLSDARNAAIDVMMGEYVTFVDSDDYIAPDYVETLYNLIKKNNTKMSVTLCLPFKDRTLPVIEHHELKETVFSKEDALISMFYQQMFDTTAWAKMYHRSLFSDGIRYPKGWLYEDLPTIYRLMMKCDYIAFLNYHSYFYRIRNTSIEGSPFKPLKYGSCMKIIRQLESDKARMSDRVRKALDCRIVSFAFHILLEVPQEYKEYSRNLLDIIKQKRMRVLLDGKARRKTRFACLLSFGGMWLVNALKKYGKSR